jgi:hypothetical protein
MLIAKKDIPESNIPSGLVVNSLPSTFMLCFGCAALPKKAGLATKLSEI